MKITRKILPFWFFLLVLIGKSSSLIQAQNRIHIGSITVTTQEQVDDLSTTLANIDTIDGNLIIGYTSGSSLSNITDLTSLSNIVRITKNLTIRQNRQLVNLTELHNLQTIGGYFNVSNNDTLTTLGDFSSLQTIGGYFNVSNNDTLTTLGDFSSLQTIGGYFSVSNNEQLITIGNFTALQTIGEYFWVNFNYTLFSLGNFPTLTNIGIGNAYVPSESQTRDNVSIVVESNRRLSDCYVLSEFLSGGDAVIIGDIFINNNAPACNSQNDIINTIYRGSISVQTQAEVDTLSNILESKAVIDGNLTIGYTDGSSQSDIIDLTPLRNIAHITGFLIIQHNRQLVNLNNLNNLQTIGGYFSVSNNDTLTTLGNSPNLISIGVRNNVYIPSLDSNSNNVSIVVESNRGLSDCHKLTEFLSGGTHAVSGQIYINNNASVCNNQDSLTSTIYSGNILVRTQAEVDALLNTLVGKTIINGHLTIGDTLGNFRSPSNITDLTPLSNITQITGDIRIQHNGQLVNLTGLDNLQTIGRSFWVEGNDTLTTLDNFPVLQSIGGHFVVGVLFGNDRLITLGTFSSLQSIRGGFGVGLLGTHDRLTTLGTFPALQTIGFVGVSSNDQLTTLGDFPSLQTIEASFGVYDNDKITSLGNFSFFTNHWGIFWCI